MGKRQPLRWQTCRSNQITGEKVTTTHLVCPVIIPTGGAGAEEKKKGFVLTVQA